MNRASLIRTSVSYVLFAVSIIGPLHMNDYVKATLFLVAGLTLSFDSYMTDHGKANLANVVKEVTP